MRVHFIAVGGSAMHNLAIALKKKEYHVSGSDDEIFEPSRTRLKNYGLLPPETGWFVEKISPELDAVIVGMHAKEDNPELIAAKHMGVKIFSYPEFLYEQSVNKTRVVIGGSHGKTTITSMILHVLQQKGIPCDYMVGAQLEGFEVMVKLSDEAKFIILEGDEYLSSPTDRRPKFHLYQPHIALISGIAWDHINVFPTFEIYLDQFRKFIEKIEPGGTLIYCAEDMHVKQLSENSNDKRIKRKPYTLPPHVIKEGQTFLTYNEEIYPLQVFGNHNLLNMAGAMEVCLEMGVAPKEFLEAIKSFKGASNRLQTLAKNNNTVVFKDFAHAPSKLKATIEAVKQQFPQRKLVACMELHTYSSLNKDFLVQYKNCMGEADEALVFYNPHALKIKRLPDISREMIYDAFSKDNLKIFSDSNALREEILSHKSLNSAFLLMSSGNFGNMDLNALAEDIIQPYTNKK